MNILFVCTGNTCRSPMAEAILRDRYPQVEVQSAGVFAADGASASDHTYQALEENGITLDHRSQPATEELLEWAELVLTMTSQHKQLLTMEYPDFTEKLYTLKEYTDEESHDYDISDPYGGDLHAYRSTRAELEDQIDRLIEKIESIKGE
ncbi:low molecular weight protein arginine phosphatase [Oceanobacillus alkalisoli]|uniref:low molecular weight protein arginine phosphatase n=1 Tax=Oceanobacillus alkalisoli TaxID=2925113 RepID=UPI00272ED4CF|nr:low molecular weight protein arginine phosphatase [Oceanobacillus alkalisoli]